jgi:hypothetical protein
MAVSSAMAPTAIGLIAPSPRCSSAAVYDANVTATAARPPVMPTSSNDQPYRNAGMGPKVSCR